MWLLRPDRLIDPVTRGDPESPLRWTSKRGAKLAEALREMGHEVVDRPVLRLLRAHISTTVTAAIGEPVIRVDAKVGVC